MTDATTAPRDARPVARRTVAEGLAVALAAGEVVTAFFIEVPVAALVMAALFLTAWALLRRGGRAGWIALGALCAVELAFLPTYDQQDAADWIMQGTFALLGVAGLVLVAAELRARRR